ncbi:hypothetical protein [Terriglobus aquaticus]|uniref:Uncharacterized protein n=1 Tax=Terriglobus aquaticus TaxID=940139 RepID=A0ABW9KP43_9BACT|nr:hypothetical protein [Terriglobus aquaticus]
MEQNTIVVMLDEEISRLRQVRTILQSLVVMEARVAPMLEAAAEEPEIEIEEQQEDQQEEQETAEAVSVVRHVSRRGIKTGQRGPRPKQAATPRPLDAAVPKAPVVVSRSALAERKPVEAAAPMPAPEATLEAWVRNFKQSQASA